MGLGFNKDKLKKNTQQAKTWWSQRNGSPAPPAPPSQQQPNIQVNVYDDDQINIQE